MPIPYDLLAYRDRNRIERMWCRLKDWRRIATRYDKLPRTTSSAPTWSPLSPAGLMSPGPSLTESVRLALVANRLCLEDFGADCIAHFQCGARYRETLLHRRVILGEIAHQAAIFE